MSEAKFTPGPWIVAGCRHSGDLKIGSKTRLHFVGPDDDAVTAVFFDMETGKGFADARLIAAAPDMYEALMEAANSAGFQYMMYETRDQIEAALAKARGEK